MGPGAGSSSAWVRRSSTGTRVWPAPGDPSWAGLHKGCSPSPTMGAALWPRGFCYRIKGTQLGPAACFWGPLYSPCPMQPWAPGAGLGLSGHLPPQVGPWEAKGSQGDTSPIPLSKAGPVPNHLRSVCGS